MLSGSLQWPTRTERDTTAGFDSPLLDPMLMPLLLLLLVGLLLRGIEDEAAAPVFGLSTISKHSNPFGNVI